MDGHQTWERWYRISRNKSVVNRVTGEWNCRRHSPRWCCPRIPISELNLRPRYTRAIQAQPVTKLIENTPYIFFVHVNSLILVLYASSRHETVSKRRHTWLNHIVMYDHVHCEPAQLRSNHHRFSVSDRWERVCTFVDVLQPASFGLPVVAKFAQYVDIVSASRTLSASSDSVWCSTNEISDPCDTHGTPPYSCLVRRLNKCKVRRKLNVTSK